MTDRIETHRFPPSMTKANDPAAAQIDARCVMCHSSAPESFANACNRPECPHKPASAQESADLVEAVARAICYANTFRFTKNNSDEASCQAENGWDLWDSEARAALSALPDTAALVAQLTTANADGLLLRLFPSPYRMEGPDQ